MSHKSLEYITTPYNTYHNITHNTQFMIQKYIRATYFVTHTEEFLSQPYHKLKIDQRATMISLFSRKQKNNQISRRHMHTYFT